jgi:hypothetical protein
MKINIGDYLIAWMALLSGLSISAVAIYYSVAGLVAIFAAAALPIIVMGVVLEVGKLVATIWLKQNWSITPWFLKSYLLLAILVLMLITSMGIFGFLSKAHIEQSVSTSSATSQVAIIDERIKTYRELIDSQQVNIETARNAVKLLDEQVSARIGMGFDGGSGAERAVQIRRQQRAERESLAKEINQAQTEIQRLNSQIVQLNEERIPLSAALREVEAKVGPIKYIAALIYGDNPDNDLLERAVRWVIIIIVLVFDPLAVVLLLASQYSFSWFRQNKQLAPSANLEIKDTVVDQDIKEKFDVSNYLDQLKTKLNLIPKEQSTIEPKEESLNLVEEVLPIEAEQDILDSVEISEKAAMSKWKAENPDGCLKTQRQLLEKGFIKELPWLQYLHPQSDYTEEDPKKKDNNLDREGRVKSDQEDNREVIYKQNAEQGSSTIWQKLKSKLNDR